MKNITLILIRLAVYGSAYAAMADVLRNEYGIGDVINNPESRYIPGR